MSSAEIRSDCISIADVHQAWVFPHFKFFQDDDTVSGEISGYQCTNVGVRFFIMDNDLKEMSNSSWKNNINFKKSIEFMSNLNEY